MNGLAPASVQAWFDSPRPGADVPCGSVRVEGWAFDEAAPFESAVLVAGDGPGVPVRLGLGRPDAGRRYPSVPHAARSGFDATLDLRAAKPGEIRIVLLAKIRGGAWQEAGAVECRAVAPARERDGTRARAFTIVQNERVMLPLWLDYYSRFFASDDLYVLDHDSTDGSTSQLDGRCHVVPVHRQASFDHGWLRSTVEAFQAFLLRSYDTVVFAEADELIVADPGRHAGLGDYLESLTGPAARCAGFQVVQQPDEPPLRFDEPLLAQRGFWHPSLQYSKRLVARVPLRWAPGFHDERNAPDDPPDPSLLLVHLHRVDYDVCLTRHRSAATRDWSEEDLALERGTQNRIAEPGEFETWFREGPDLDTPREPIPERIRSLL